MIGTCPQTQGYQTNARMDSDKARGILQKMNRISLKLTIDTSAYYTADKISHIFYQLSKFDTYF